MLDGYPKLVAIDEEPDHEIVHRRLGKAPIRRLLSRGNTSPFPQLLAFFPLCSARHTPPPRGSRRRIRVFMRVVSAPMRRTSHPSGSRPFDVSLLRQTSAPGIFMPQKTLGSLSCPIVYSVQITWLPRGSTFARAHGRGVAPLGHAVAGHLYGLRPGLIRTDGYSPTFPPASSLNPTASQTSAKGFRRLKGHEVAHHVIAGP